ncbi:MAG: FAD-dependent oxidoreductase [Alphaproteobacteria bacterium]|nr:FAD-dependent oxidoreductase [Alphaproteobacteria bacterium]
MTASGNRSQTNKTTGAKNAAICDIAVVGAGMAGMAAALRLQDEADAPLSILLLEACDAVGGRMKTREIGGVPCDTGAHWFHGGHENPLFRWMTQRYPQLETAFDDVSRQFSVEKGQVHGPAFRSGNLEMMDAAYTAFKKENPGKDTSLADIARRTGDGGALETAAFFARCWMAEDDAEKVSADEFFGCPYSVGGGVVKGGVSRLIDAMKEELEARGARILTGCAISSIEQDASKVTLADAQGGIYEAAHAIVALPLGVLKAGKVRFAPALSRGTQEYIDATSIACFTKIVIPVDAGFFAAQNIAPDTHIDILDEKTFCHCHTGGAPFITLMAGGRDARAVEKMDEKDLQAFIAKSLDAVPPLSGWRDALRGTPVVTGWNNAPETLGAYTAVKISGKRRDAQREGRIILCGEAFAGEKDEAEGASMTVGAWFSGRRAADMTMAERMREAA